MDELLTWAEIERRFKGEWVVIDNPETTEELEIIRGRVVYHGKDREAGDACIDAMAKKRAAVLFVGDPVPEGSFAIL